jgi:thiol-disulfide isomerase/thioredoxin
VDNGDIGRMKGSQGRSPQEFLRWSMDRYAEMSTFRATTDVTSSRTGGVRQIVYARPNRFKIVSAGQYGYVATSVCDGRTLIEYANRAGHPASSYRAPRSISAARSTHLKLPMFCGSLLHQFFSGAANLDKLANLERAAIAFEGEEEMPAERGIVISFYGVELFGGVKALIGVETGLVYRITYDSEPMAESMKSAATRLHVRKQLINELSRLPPGTKGDGFEAFLFATIPDSPEDLSTEFLRVPLTIESYRDIEVNGALAADCFDTTVPDGFEVVERGPGAKPPLPLGEPAPDFTVQALDGESLSLVALRGKVVLIDLWATWCGPCRKGLPDTAKLAAFGAAHGFHVLAVSREPGEKVAEFIRDEGLGTLPVYLDRSEELWSRYKIGAIPTVLVIDAAGNLAAYLVGLRPIEELKAALRAAGVEGFHE